MNVDTRKRRILVVMIRLRGVVAEKAGNVLFLRGLSVSADLMDAINQIPSVIVFQPSWPRSHKTIQKAKRMQHQQSRVVDDHADTSASQTKQWD